MECTVDPMNFDRGHVTNSQVRMLTAYIMYKLWSGGLALMEFRSTYTFLNTPHQRLYDVTLLFS